MKAHALSIEERIMILILEYKYSSASIEFQDWDSPDSILESFPSCKVLNLKMPAKLLF